MMTGHGIGMKVHGLKMKDGRKMIGLVQFDDWSW